MAAGNAPLVLVRVQHDDFDAAAESARLTAGRQDVGASEVAGEDLTVSRRDHGIAFSRRKITSSSTRPEKITRSRQRKAP